PAPALEARLDLASLGIGPGGEGGEGAAQAAVLRVLRREPLEHAADRAQGERLFDQQRDPLWRERWRGDVEPAPLRRADMAVGEVAREQAEALRSLSVEFGEVAGGECAAQRRGCVVGRLEP